ncbi:hypothetical protein FHS15_005535 [Paenibacillus castaneae]|uniref:DUF2087 domain-containing protein n=1 Tax=Paenibacillus castaneae TaxID=474957 RepID=UPI000C9C4A83|nr:DUF2087 domain-containing protein [Paenibacillus castaneae]NIK80351.1 hypothetical protein [Paenibacillus castaneae]
MDLNERFWSSSIEELKLGYVYDAVDDAYHCLTCGERFEDGEIFRHEDTGRLYEARKYAALHVQHTHGSMLAYLLELDKKLTGLTDLQKELIRGFAENVSDTELMNRTGAGSASTIRNHRFVLKEKAKQAKLVLTIMELMEQDSVAAPQFAPILRTATQVDARYVITENEYADLIKQYLPNGPDGPLASYPRKEKRKLAVLRHIASYFKNGIRYEEKEVNELLSQFWAEDYVLLRRNLIDYGYLDRNEDGHAYWVKGLETEQVRIDKGKDVMSVKKEVQNNKNDKSAKQGIQEREAQEQQNDKKEVQKIDKAKRKQLTAEYQERERSMGVFQIKNNVNGRIYIGGSTNLDALWGKEQFVLSMDGHTNKELQKEWKQFGSENFSYLVLETVKTDQKIRYDYKDVLDAEGRQPVDMVHQYNREVASLKEQWLSKLQPYGEKGYHSPAEEGKR